jgi:predicted DNA-binding transcriptional regulator YafY
MVARTSPTRTTSTRPRGARKPYALTYAVPTRLVELAFLLAEPRRSVTPREIARRLDVDTRTAQRYLGALRAGIFNGTTHPAVLHLEDRAGRAIVDPDEGAGGRIPVARIARASLAAPAARHATEAPIAALLPLYLAFTVLRFLDGIVPRARVTALWRELARGIGAADALGLSGLDRKFFAVPYTPKTYEACGEVLADVVEALVRQQVLRIGYYGLRGEGKTHRFEPYTLAMYKGGLYLVGKSDRNRTLTVLTVERIDTVEKVRDATGRPVTFPYPADYSPEQRFQGVFGMIEGADTEVELEILDREIEARIRERLIHPSQRFVARRGTPTLLRMRLRGTTELVPWILSHGPYLRVRRPPALRREVEELARRTAGLYGR